MKKLCTALIVGLISFTVGASENITNIIKHTPGCLTLGPFQVCDPITDPRESLTWRAYDRTSPSRQDLILQRTLKENQWLKSQVRRLSDAHPLATSWNAYMSRVSGGAILGTLPILSELNKLGDIRFLAADIPPAIIMSLKRGKVVYRKQYAKPWVMASFSNAEIQRYCTEKLQIKLDSCANELFQLEERRVLENIEFALKNEMQFRQFMDATIGFFEFKSAENSWESTPRNVYLVDATATPQTDMLGNLYLSSVDYNRFSRKELQFVMYHEAAHHSNTVSNQLLSVAFHFSKSSVADTLKAGVDGILTNFIMALKFPDESAIDLLAADIFSLSPQDMREYAAAIRKFENPPEDRFTMLDNLSIVLEKVPASQLMARKNDVFETNCGTNKISLSIPKQWKDPRIADALKRYESADIRFQSKMAANRLIFAAGEKSNQVPKNLENSIFTDLTWKGCTYREFADDRSRFSINLGSLLLRSEQ